MTDGGLWLFCSWNIVNSEMFSANAECDGESALSGEVL